MKPFNGEMHDLVVVDSQPEDYQSLLAELSCWRVHCHLYSTGDEALRRTGVSTTGPWLINTQLPDMQGVELLKLVRQRVRTASVFLVSDAYNPQEEVAVRAAGATAYLCKPPSITWLHSFAISVRAGPARDQLHVPEQLKFLVRSYSMVEANDLPAIRYPIN